MIEAGGHVKPELTGEDPAKFAGCPVETAQETRAGEPGRQPVEEVLQTPGRRRRNAMSAPPRYGHGQKQSLLFRRRRADRNPSPCPAFRRSLMTVETQEKTTVIIIHAAETGGTLPYLHPLPRGRNNIVPIFIASRDKLSYHKYNIIQSANSYYSYFSKYQL